MSSYCNEHPFLFIEHFQENDFYYQKFGMRELRTVRGSRAIALVDTTIDCRASVTTMKAINFNEEFPVSVSEPLHTCIRFQFTSRCSIKYSLS